MTDNKKTFSGQRRTSFDTSKLKSKLSGGEKKSYKDDRFWFPARDKVGNGEAIIRVLPGVDTDDAPITVTHSHSWQGPSGQWFIEDCPSTISQPCPICTKFFAVHKSSNPADKELAGKISRKTHYIVNALVIKDPANPENEGQVRLYKFGSQLMKKIIVDQVDVPGEDEPRKMEAFDVGAGGGNFKIKIANKAGFPNYEDSTYGKLGALNVDAARLDEILGSQHALGEFTDPKRYKSADELTAKYEKVMNSKMGAMTKSASEDTSDEGKEFEKAIDNLVDGIGTVGKSPKPTAAKVEEDEDFKLDVDDDELSKLMDDED